jgi:hypothetical protein
MKIEELINLSDNISNINFERITDFDSKKQLTDSFDIEYNNQHGVYIFEHNIEGIIYIGSSGKIDSQNKKTKQGIRLRILQGRFPYMISNSEIKYNYLNGKYNNNRHLRNLTIYFNNLEGNNFFTLPTVLEHFLIQLYYNETNKLTLINKKI